jgi:uncharacterized protein YciI
LALLAPGWRQNGLSDAIFDEGFLLLAGPLEGDRHTLWVVEAESEDEIRRRMKDDPWSANGMLTPITLERWTIVLDRLPKPNNIGS